MRFKHLDLNLLVALDVLLEEQNITFAAARLHYSAIIERHPESGIVPDAIYQSRPAGRKTSSALPGSAPAPSTSGRPNCPASR